MSDLVRAAAAAATFIRRFSRWTPVLAGLLTVGLVRLAQADARPEPAGEISIERVEVGFRGAYKVGEWARLRVWVQSARAQEIRLVVDCTDADDDRTILPSRLFTVVSGAGQLLETCFRTGRLEGELSIQLAAANGDTLFTHRLQTSRSPEAPWRPALREDEGLWATLGPLPDLARGSIAEAPPAAAERVPAAGDPHVVRLESLDELPLESLGLESLDVLVLPTEKGAAGASPLSQLTTPVDTVLREWVGGGGHLLLSVATESELYARSLLAQWVPVPLEGQVNLRQLHGLEKFSGLNAPLKMQELVVAARLRPQQSWNTLVSQEGHPLVVSVPYGFGRVTVLALDLDRQPLRGWRGLPAVLRNLVDYRSRSGPSVTRSANRQLTHLGVSDLETQWQSALEDFGTVERPSFWSVLGLIAVYLCVVGPLDWLVVNRWLKRPGLTWLTLPIWLCAGAAAAAWGATQANAKGVQVNQVDVTDVDTASRKVRSQTWVAFYNDANRRCEVKITPDSGLLPSDANKSTRLTWQAAPEANIGGLYRGSGAGGGGRAYRFAPESQAVENLPILQWSTRSLRAESEWSLTGSPLESQLESVGKGQIAGAIVSNLTAPLEQCLLVVDGWAYWPTGESAVLRPGVPWRPGQPRRELRALMTGMSQTHVETRGKIGREIVTTTVPWNPLNHSSTDLLRMVTLHDAAGGSEYTGLANAGLRELELTDLMNLGRGILIGRLGASAAQVQVDGHAVRPVRRDSYVRFVVPVDQPHRAPEKAAPAKNRNAP
ncbi:MAG: hypothetical protein ACT4QC_05685 [Planctomycetaceae bacterium]